MRAAIYPGHGLAPVIDRLPDPEPGAGEVIIRVDRCGICGTDLSMTKGELFDYGPGSQFGHEYGGEVVALGKGVSELNIGDKITVLPSGACGDCDGCRGGNYILCHNAPGVMRGFAELANIPVSSAVKLPAVLSFADAALVEPLAVSLYGVRQSGIQPGDSVLVLGGGTVALYTIYWARRLGAGRIVAMSRSLRRRELVLAMGADAFLAYGDNAVGEVVEALGGAPDIVYECVGSEGMLGKAVQHAKRYGKVVSLGFCTHMDPVMPALGAMKCVTIQFLVGYGLRDFRYVADQMDKGHVDPKAIISNQIALDELPAMMATLRGANHETKVHVRC